MMEDDFCGMCGYPVYGDKTECISDCFLETEEEEENNDE